MLTSMFKLFKELEVYLHYAHLKTTSYAQHVALGNTYSVISSLNDKLAENLYRVTDDLLIPPTLTINDNVEKDGILEYITYTQGIIRTYVNSYSLQLEIQDILLEYLQELNKLQYLLSLN